LIGGLVEFDKHENINYNYNYMKISQNNELKKKSKYPVQILLTRELSSLCKKESLKITDCHRSTVGSINHFIKQAIIDKLLKNGIDRIYLKSIC